VEKEFTINFGGPMTSEDKWLLGGFLGGGAAYQIPPRQGSVFAEYQHIWVDRASMRMPLASPGFNYSFENELDIWRIGASIPLSGITQVVSDIRLKHDIHLVGHADNGLNLYRYRYLWSDTEYVGVMAQEVA